MKNKLNIHTGFGAVISGDPINLPKNSFDTDVVLVKKSSEEGKEITYVFSGESHRVIESDFHMEYDKPIDLSRGDLKSINSFLSNIPKAQGTDIQVRFLVVPEPL